MIRLGAGCYGKLPHFGDFVRFNSDSAENETIDRWFCDGAANLFAGSDDSALSAFDQVPPVCCIFRSRHMRRRVGAVIIASRDRVGRRYPFAIMSGLDDEVFRGEMVLLLAAFIPFFDRALQADLSGWSDDLEGLSGQIRGAVDADVDLESQAHLLAAPLAKMSCVQFWSSLFGSFEDPRKYIAIANLIAQLTNPQSSIYGLRFPPIATQAHVIFWPLLSWLLQGRSGFPEMIAMQTGRPGLTPGMTLLWGHPPNTVHFAALWPSCRGVGSSAGIFEVAGTLRHGAILSERYRDVLDDPELMVDGLIYGLLAASKS